MPRIFIDGEERRASGSQAPTTVGELLAELNHALAGSQRMIREVSLDGVGLTAESLLETAPRQTTAVEAVELRTMTYRELARFGLERADLLLQHVIREAEESAGSFRLQSQPEAHRTYAICLEDLQLFVEMVEQALKLTDRPSLPREGGGAASYPSPARGEGQGGGEVRKGDRDRQESDRLESQLARLAAITGQLLMAYRRDDVMVLADLLAFELVPHLQVMQEALSILRERVEAR